MIDSVSLVLLIPFRSEIIPDYIMVQIAVVAVFVVLLSGVALSAPQGDVQLVRYDNDNKGDGNYVYT